MPYLANYGFRLWLVMFLLSIANGVLANDAELVLRLLDQDRAPDGVVFEIAVKDENALDWALPRIQKYTGQLREKFRDLPIAVVSHGREMFALQTESSTNHGEVHDAVKKLALQENVPVHICQTHASWRNVQPEDFPSYVSVSPTGPQQVKDYVELGYVLIKIRNN